MAPDPPFAPGFGYLSAEVPPVPCLARVEPEDFEVEEELGFEPAGQGEHLYLWVEKVGLGTEQAVESLARATGLARERFGFAGRKDRNALTRQWISAAGLAEARAEELALPGLRVLCCARHPVRLRLGAHAANRFRLRLRALAPAHRPRLEAVLARIRAKGLPNWFGPQRFGLSGRSFELGRLLQAGRLEEYALALCGPLHAGGRRGARELEEALRSGSRSALRRAARFLPPELARFARQLERRRGDYASALRALGPGLLGLHLSALQSLVFNAVLARRLAGDPAGLDALVPGDLAWRHADGELVPVGPKAPDPGLAERLELSPSGPLPGPRAPQAMGEVAALEHSIALAQGFLDRAPDAPRLPVALRGSRRPLRVPLPEIELAWDSDAALLAFRLPPGSFASALLEEIQKSSLAPVS
jgi:tRNA pseudouridine13 synthase